MANYYVDKNGKITREKDKKQFEDNDIAPVKSNTKSESKSWFQSGALADGYDFGDITKTILGTGYDVTKNLTAGVLGMGEKVVDANALAFGKYSEMTSGKSPLAKAAISIPSLVLNPFLGAAAIAGSFDDNLSKKTDEFVKKDLYDENKVADYVAPLSPVGAGKLFGIYDEEDSVLGSKSDSLVQSAGQLGATAALQAVGVPWWATTAITSFGGEVENALNQGATKEEAMLSGAISAGAELFFEHLSGGVQFPGMGTLDDGLTKALARGISNKAVRTLAKLGVDVVGEGGEEVLTGIVSAFGQKMTYADEAEMNELFSSEDAWESFIGGAVLGGAGGAVQAVGKKAQGRDYASGLTANEEAVVKKLYEAELAEAKKNGTKVNKNDLWDSIVNQMDRGEISIDTIEEVLGGDEYTAYKSLVDEQNAHLKDLAKMFEGDELKAQQDNYLSDSKRDELKSQLRKSVFGKVITDNGSRLLNSYAETEARGVKFTANVDDYEGEYAKKTIQNIIDAESGNNTRLMHELADLLAKTSEDKKTVFSITDAKKLAGTSFAFKDQTTDGYVVRDADGVVKEVVINLDSPKYLNRVVGHEVTHILEGTEFYDTFRGVVEEYARSKGEYETELADAIRLYSDKDGYKGQAGLENIKKEVVANLVGKYIFSDSEFVKNLSVKNRNIFEKVYDEIKYFCKVAKAGSKEEKQLLKVKKAFEDAYRADTVKKTDGETQLSVSDSVEEVPLNQRLSGDALLDAEDLISEIEGVAEITPNGYVTVYHRTTEENAKKIMETGKMSAKEDGIFFSTQKDGEYSTDYGGGVVELRVPVEKLVLDDIFDTEAHLKIPLKNRNDVLDVSDYLPTSDTDIRYSLSMEDFASNGSPVWRIVDYYDDSTKQNIMRETHEGMVADGIVVNVPEDVLNRVDESFPDLRGVKKKDRTPILKESMRRLKDNLRQFLVGFKNQGFEFEVDGKVLEAKLYNTGINEVLEKVTKDKANMLYTTEEIFRNARYLYSTADYDSDPNVYRWNYFYTPVQIGENVVGVRVAVRDVVQGQDHLPESQIYNWGIKKDASLGGVQPVVSDSSHDTSSDASNDIIPQKEGNVKWSLSDPESEDIRYSLSSIGNAFFGDPNMSAEQFKKSDYTQTQGYKDYLSQCVNNVKQSKQPQYSIATDAEIEEALGKQIKGIIDVAIAAKQAGYDIFDDPKKRDLRDSKNRLLFSSLEPNSDYFTSNDISSICDKRKNFAEIYDEIVRQEEAKNVPVGKRFFDNVDNYFAIHKTMADKGLTTPCRQCYVESMRKNLAPMAKSFLQLVNETDPNNKFNDQLYHTKGKKKGELKTGNADTRTHTLDALAEYGMSAENLTVEMLTTAEGLATLKITAPKVYEQFNSFYGQSKPKMPRGATPFRPGELTALLTKHNGEINEPLVNRINSTGGFRLQSYSDFQIENFVDTLQVLFEAGTLGLRGHSYTKVPAFLDATEGTNLKRNISIFMYKDGNEWKLDRNDSFPYSLEEIYDIVNGDSTGNTGIIAVSQNEDMSCWIMANDNIGYFIPFHKSGIKMDTVRDTNVVTEDGRTIKGYSGIKDHTRQQSEVWAFTNADHKVGTKVKTPINIYLFWDFRNTDNLSKSELIEKNVKAYIDACEEAGYLPKFRELVTNNRGILNKTLQYAKELGSVPQDATISDIAFEYKGYTIPYGYYKCLGDFGMFTPDGRASSQEILSLKDYDFAKAVEFFKDSEALRREEILQQFANGEERQKYRDSDLTAEQLTEIVNQKRTEVARDVIDNRYAKAMSLSEEGVAPVKHSATEISGADVRLQTPVAEVAPVAETAGVAPVAETVAPAPVKEKSVGIKPKKKKAKPDNKMIRVKDDSAPTSQSTEERRWVGTSTSSEAVDGAVTPDDIPDELRYYQVKGNKQTLETANTRLNNMGYDRSVTYFKGKLSERKVTVEDIALGERLIQEAVKAGDTKTAMDLIADVSILGTELGQKVQALSIIKKLTPEGQLGMLQKIVERGKAKGDKAYDGVEVTEAQAETILKTRKKDGTYDQDELNKAVEDAKQQIADQMKVTGLEKVNAWRYLSMLGNPKTHIRNLVSNVAMRGTITAKNALARTIEDIAPVKNRTKTWKSASDTVKEYAQKTTMEMKDIISDGGKYNEEASLKAMRKTFKNKVLNRVYEFNSDMLSREDWWFSKSVFQKSFSEFLTANGIETEQDIYNNPETIEKARNYALEQSQIATFRQYSWLANKINEIERKNIATNIAVGSIVPFKKTPINIAKTGLNYSPLGFAKTLTYDAVQVKNGNMEASEMIDHLSQNVTGTALTLVGYMLASMGFLNGGGEDDKEGKYDYQLGEQAYSVNIGGATFSLSWLSPIAMPLFVGANAYEQLVEGKEWNGDVVVETLAQTLDPLSEMSFLSSLDTVLSSYDSGIQKFAGIGESMAQNYITQFVPTLSSQLAATIDDTKRTTKVSGDSDFKFFDQTINNLKYKIPFLRQTLEPTTDIWGNEVKQTENLIGRAVENFIAPYARKENIATEIDEEIKALYSETGDSGLIPSVPYNYVNYDGEKYKMSAKEFTEYKKLYGQNAYDLMEDLFATSVYQNATDEEKADMVNKVYDYARDEATKSLLEGRDVHFTNAESEGTKYYRVNPIKGAIENNMYPDEYTFYTKYPEKYRFLKDEGVSYKEWDAFDEDTKRAYTWLYENPTKKSLVKAVTNDVVKYRDLSGALYDVKADKDSSGKSVSGSRKEKVIDYINGLDLDYGEKIILFKNEYNSDDTYNWEIIEYLNGRSDISYKEMEAILKELGFTVHSDGRITWD